MMVAVYAPGERVHGMWYDVDPGPGPLVPSATPVDLYFTGQYVVRDDGEIAMIFSQPKDHPERRILDLDPNEPHFLRGSNPMGVNFP